MIKTITFDFGGVLYDYYGERLLSELASSSKETIDNLKAVLQGSELDRAHFRGEIKAAELLEILEDMVGLKMIEDELASAYANSVEPKEEMFDLVRELNGHYNLQLYSDTPKILYDRVMTDMPIFDLFSSATLSFEVGQLKDSPEGHKEVIKKAGHSAEEIVFIDDREEFVEQASELGIKGIKFTGMSKLIDDLTELGVKLDGKFDF
ncbi:HAD hydrolase-like protein [Candidatus Bipolaricaulota bacterium]|nr:HAD hydrolase-like protein [Candidatus Bipolaricaulota bacterium]